MDEIGEMKEGGEEAASQPSMAVQPTDRKAQRGMVGRIWSGMGSLFSRGNKNDFEKKLQHLTKEEVAVHSRLKRRSQFWRKLARAIIIYSVVGEVGVLFNPHYRFHEGNHRHYHLQNPCRCPPFFVRLIGLTLPPPFCKIALYGGIGNVFFDIETGYVKFHCRGDRLMPLLISD